MTPTSPLHRPFIAPTSLLPQIYITLQDLENNHNNILPDGTLTLELKITKQGRLFMSVYKLSTKVNT